MRNSSLWFLILALGLLNFRVAYGKEASPQRCQEALQISSSNIFITDAYGRTSSLKRNKNYWVQLKNEPNIRELMFQRIVKTKNQERFLEFVKIRTDLNLPKKTLATYRFRASEIMNLKAADEDSLSLSDQLRDNVSSFFSVLQEFNEGGQFLTKKYYRISDESDALEFFSTSKTLQERPPSSIKKIKYFDQMMLDIGLRLPQKSRVIFSPQWLTPHFMGPYSLNVKSWNLWQKKGYDATIFMGPSDWNNRTVGDPEILFHERAHSILFYTYNDYAYINSNLKIQEAMADFLAAHYSNTPLVGTSINSPFGGLRHLSERQSKEVQGVFQPQKAFDGLWGSDHGNSLLFSNTLWRIRTNLSASVINPLLKPFFDQLNANHRSYLILLQKEGRTGNDSISDVSTDLEFFLANLLLVGKNLSEIEELKLNQTIETIAIENHYSYDRLAYVAKRLTPDGFNYEDPRQNNPLDKIHLLFQCSLAALFRWSSAGVTTFFLFF